MTSRFFATGSDSESESDVSDTEIENQNQYADRFEFDSSSDEEEKRVVRSAKDKKWEELENIIRTIRNAMKIDDWHSILTKFLELQVTMKKAVKIIKKEGTPRFFLKLLCDLDRHVIESKKDQRNKKNGKAYNTIKMKLGKEITAYKRQLDAFREMGLDKVEDDGKADATATASAAAGSDVDSDPDSGSDDDSKANKPAGDSGDSDSDEDEMSGSDEWDSDLSDDDSDWDSDADDSDEEGGKRGIQFTRYYWTKQYAIDHGKGGKKNKAGKKRERDHSKKEKKSKVEDAEAKKKNEELTPERLMKKLHELLGQRGKRSIDREQMVEDLKLLASKAKDPAALLKVNMTLVSSIFDLSLNKGLSMPVAHWRSARTVLDQVIDALLANPSIRLSEGRTDVVEDFEIEQDEDVVGNTVEGLATIKENGDEVKEDAAAADSKDKEDGDEEKKEDAGVRYVIGNLYSFIQRMADEYYKSLQAIDAHQEEYIERLRDMAALTTLVEKSQKYYQNIGKVEFEALVTSIRLDYEYYHYHPEFDCLKTLADSHEAATSEGKEVKVELKYKSLVPESKSELVPSLAAFLYKHGEPRSRIRALLCHAYHLALHNNYQKARDLLLMSHVQDNINGSDIRSRILYNRTIAQMGLCAFRIGKTTEGLYSLSELYQSGRVKELIAQGTSSRYYHQDRDFKREKEERARQYPYHMHMNLDMLETSHLICAMLAEVPNMATSSMSKKRVFSKPFRRLYDHHRRQAFNGPPENTRDLIMAASKALAKGDWKNCIKLIFKLRMWNLIPFAKYVQSILVNKIKLSALRVYLLTYAPQYTSVDKQRLVDMFEIEPSKVHRLVSKLIDTDRLHGAWDETGSCVLIHASKPSSLQQAALNYTEKIGIYIEQNERLDHIRTGGRQYNDYNRRHKGAFAGYSLPTY